MESRGPQTPNATKMESRGPQISSRWYQRDPKSHQDGVKGTPNLNKMASGGPPTPTPLRRTPTPPSHRHAPRVPPNLEVVLGVPVGVEDDAGVGGPCTPNPKSQQDGVKGTTNPTKTESRGPQILPRWHQGDPKSQQDGVKGTTNPKCHPDGVKGTPNPTKMVSRGP